MHSHAARPARLDAAGDLLRAIRQQDWDHADVLLRQLTGPQDTELRRAVAVLHARRQRWSDAAEMLDGLDGTAALLQRTLFRNLAAVKAHRPLVYRALTAADGTSAYVAHGLPSGEATVARVTASGAATPLCADPSGTVRRALEQLAPVCQKGDAIALLSVGDGHVATALAASPPRLFMDRQQPIYLIEPDPHLLLACLQLHDYTGPLGPIEQPRVLWYVGPRWAEALRLDMVTDRYLPFPAVNVKQTAAAAAIERKLTAILGELGRLDATAATEVATHYAGQSAPDFGTALSGRAGRRPRVLLLTTRLSTVLQYSTRDAEDAFRRLGCETALVIEPSPFHAITRLAIRRTLAEFKPDMVLQIDHHRFEHGDLFPPNLPFVNWIQDVLPHLTTPAAGRQLGAFDFVLAPSLQRWVNEFAYPAAQCLEFRKLTRVPSRPTSWASDDRRVVYVSNWSQAPDGIKAELVRETTGEIARVVGECCDRMVAVYTAGGALPTAGHVRRVVQDVARDLGLRGTPDLITQTTTRLFDRLNNLLFRQQGLAWAAEACRQTGLTLEIYGRGWDNQAAFAPYARGVIDYGEPLERLTRSAAVNLILEPFVCIAHQRLLDATVAGGFSLIRDNPASDVLQRTLDLSATVRGKYDSAATLKAVLRDATRRQTLDDLLNEFAYNDGSVNGVDPIGILTGLQRAGFLPPSGPLLPHLNAVTFDTPVRLRQGLERFTRDPELRSSIARVQRNMVAERYSYVAGMAKVLAFVVERLQAPPGVIRLAA